MRERAVAVGGALEAGPRPEGGWRVAAWLPIDRRPAQAS
jgi:signal transduction histidine kinase